MVRRWKQPLVVIAVLAAAGCGTSEKAQEQPGVASLSSGAPASASAAPTRPRERLDMSDADYEAMLKPFKQCIRDHGAKNKEDFTNPATARADAEKLEAASKICTPLYGPLPPWEKDPANPEAKDFALDVVKCLRNKGVKHVAVGKNGVDIEFGGSSNDQSSISKGLQYSPECERSVAAKK